VRQLVIKLLSLTPALLPSVHTEGCAS